VSQIEAEALADCSIVLVRLQRSYDLLVSSSKHLVVCRCSLHWPTCKYVGASPFNSPTVWLTGSLRTHRRTIRSKQCWQRQARSHSQWLHHITAAPSGECKYSADLLHRIILSSLLLYCCPLHCCPSNSIWPHLSYGLARSKRGYCHNCSLVVVLCSFL